MALKTNVYVDGFNLYYGCVRGTTYKWLDLAAFCRRLLPTNQIVRIRYFTALLTPRPNDPQQRNRQEIYIRALRTIPNISIDLGHFMLNKVWMMKSDLTGTVQVLKSEEKGSDVNLASRLLIDCYLSKCDIAVIVSNDSDLLFPIEHVKRHLGKTIGIVNPHARPSRELRAVASFYKSIRPSLLARSQFPDVMTDAQGQFHKPASW